MHPKRFWEFRFLWKLVLSIGAFNNIKIGELDSAGNCYYSVWVIRNANSSHNWRTILALKLTTGCLNKTTNKPVWFLNTLYLLLSTLTRIMLSQDLNLDVRSVLKKIIHHLKSDFESCSKKLSIIFKSWTCNANTDLRCSRASAVTTWQTLLVFRAMYCKRPNSVR